MTIYAANRSALSGFRLSMGVTLAYVTALLVVPLGGLLLKTASISFPRWVHLLTDPRLHAALALSFGGSAVSAAINCIFGFILAWILARYTFPGRRLLDAMVDLPFALPTAVSGIALTTLYAPGGWLGSTLAHAGLRVAYTRGGVVVAMTFVGLPFVVRTLQPAIKDLAAEVEEASYSLGASGWATFRRVLLPTLTPPLLTGVTLAFARAVGEYGSIVFIAGNLPMRTEIAPLLIVVKLEQYDYEGATAVALVMLLASFALLFAINTLQNWSRKGAQ